MPDNRDYPDRPFLGVSAIVQSTAGILLIERGKPPLAGIWSLPGGIVETGESLEEAVRRELEEETGLAFQPERLARIVEIIRPDRDGKTQRHYVIGVFFGTSPEMPLLAGDDAAKALWVPFDQLANYPLTDGTYEVIQTILDEQRASDGPLNAATTLLSF